MRAILTLVGLSLLTGGGARTEIEPDETLQVVTMNQVEMDAFVEAQKAFVQAKKAQLEAQKVQMKYQAAIGTSKALIDKLKATHGAQGCDLNRSTMRWENCKAPIDKKVSKP